MHCQALDQESRMFAQGGLHRAVTLIQRFGSALNLIHFHMLFLDGVYVDRPDGSARFRWVRAPTTAERRAAMTRAQRLMREYSDSKLNSANTAAGINRTNGVIVFSAFQAAFLANDQISHPILSLAPVFVPATPHSTPTQPREGS
jgi:hypothetical protein